MTFVVDTGGPAVASTILTPFSLPSNRGAIEETAAIVIPMQRHRLQLTSVNLVVTAALDYGSQELCTLANKNLIFCGCEINLTMVKGNVTNGIVAAKDLDVSIGTAAASATTLATTMLNIMPKVDMDDDLVTVVVKGHSLATTPVFTGVLDSASNKLYLNVAVVGGITADDALTVTGTIDLFYWDLGNVAP